LVKSGWNGYSDPTRVSKAWPRATRYLVRPTSYFNTRFFLLSCRAMEPSNLLNPGSSITGFLQATKYDPTWKSYWQSCSNEFRSAPRTAVIGIGSLDRSPGVVRVAAMPFVACSPRPSQALESMAANT